MKVLRISHSLGRSRRYGAKPPGAEGAGFLRFAEEATALARGRASPGASFPIRVW